MAEQASTEGPWASLLPLSLPCSLFSLSTSQFLTSCCILILISEPPAPNQNEISVRAEACLFPAASPTQLCLVHGVRPENRCQVNHE